MQSPACWTFPTELSRLELLIVRRLQRNGRLFAFLRKHRHELFDEAFQTELAAMYSDMPRGTPPKPPALLAMVTLLQAYERKSDAAAVEEAVFDRRWQMVLDCLGTEEPIFSQGVLVDFRRRLVEHDMDRRLLERTVELARCTKQFGDKALRVALDSAPLWGAGRVEDTFNLLGHALDVVVECAAQVLGVDTAAVRADAKLQLLGGSSLKASLDIDRDAPQEQQRALASLLDEVKRLRDWLGHKLPDHLAQPPLKEAIALVERVIAQDLEPDPGGGVMRIKPGVSKDRRISVTDPDMRHGRKSKSKLFNSTWTHDLFERGQRILAKPWPSRNGDRFPKSAFVIDLDRGVVRCPENRVTSIHLTVARFDAATCDVCPSRDRCTRASLGHGRSISIHPDERMLIHLRAFKSTPEGRSALRQRTAIEHVLAHVTRRQGPRARYSGLRKNVFDLRRTCAVENLHALDRPRRAA